MSIIDQLRRAIERSGESQAEIARSTGINRTMLNQFIQGERSASLDNAAILCQHLRLKLVSKRQK